MLCGKPRLISRIISESNANAADENISVESVASFQYQSAKSIINFYSPLYPYTLIPLYPYTLIPTSANRWSPKVNTGCYDRIGRSRKSRSWFIINIPDKRMVILDDYFEFGARLSNFNTHGNRGTIVNNGHRPLS